MATEDREKQFERALARHFSHASPDSACPEAEILAAYQERTLSLEEIARWGEHIRACTRCQESLALLEQTENMAAGDGDRQMVEELDTIKEQASAAAAFAARGSVLQSENRLPAAPVVAGGPPILLGKPTARPPWGWLVPMGTLAAAVIVWIGVREIRTQHFNQGKNVQVAENRAPVPQPPALERAPAASARSEAQLAQKIGPGATSVGTPAPAKPSAPSPLANDRLSSTANELATENRKETPPSVPRGRIAAPPLPLPAYSNAPKSDAVGGAMTQRSAGASAQSAAALNSSLSAETKEAAKKMQPQTAAANPTAQATNTTLSYSSSPVPATEAGNLAGLARISVEGPRYIPTTDKNRTWRLGDAGSIERSTDGGKSWKAQNSGVSADLTAGSATSDEICWVVGKAGTVLLTTDGGKHWKRISSPITDDLGGVHATDADHAFLWDVPNRKSFETSDSGATWTRIANE
jgi:Photosynthesis system II assembly factor YCF48